VHVVQASCFLDPLGREPDALLEAWPSLGRIASATAEAGATVTVVQAAARDAVLEHDGIHFRFVAERQPSDLQRRLGPWSWPAPRKLARGVSALRPGIVHVHGLSFARQAALLAAAAPGAALLVQDHADHPPQAWKRPLVRPAFRRMSGVAFTAEAQAEPFRTAGLLQPPTRVFAVPESSSTFTPGDRAEARAATGLHGDPCFLWLGRLDASKDPFTILDALLLASSALPEAQLWCCFRSAPLLDAVHARMPATRRSVTASIFSAPNRTPVWRRCCAPRTPWSREAMARGAGTRLSRPWPAGPCRSSRTSPPFAP
jgi:hypothetical protein